MAIIYNLNSRYYNSDTTDELPQHNMLKDNYAYTTTKILANEDSRLDLVSYRVYNTPVHWWLIARFNSIINPETARAGMVVKIPIL